MDFDSMLCGKEGPFSEFEIKQKVNKYIAEFRIFAIRAYNKEDAIRFYNS